MDSCNSKTPLNFISISNLIHQKLLKLKIQISPAHPQIPKTTERDTIFIPFFQSRPENCHKLISNTYQGSFPESTKSQCQPRTESRQINNKVLIKLQKDMLRTLSTKK